MKNTSAILIIVAICLLASCIPSLHGIVTEETQLIDDEILGEWRQDDMEIQTVDIKTTSDEGKDSEKKALEDLHNFISGKGESMIWTFERAGSMTFESGDRKRSVQLSMGAPSMAPAEMEVTERSLLPFYILTHSEKSLGDTLTTRMLVYLTEIGGQGFMDFIPYPLKAKELQGRFAGNHLYAHTFAKYHIKDEVLQISPIDAEYIESLIKQKRIRLKHERIGDDEIVLTASTEELRSFLTKYVDDPALFSDDEILSSIEGE